MTPTLFREDETRQWLACVREDLAAAETLISLPAPLTKSALFHCQQAAEKAMKAFLVWHERSFPKTHDLATVGRQCISIDASLETCVRRSYRLTQFAVLSRYPGEFDEPTPEEARGSLAVARSLLAAILDRLPQQVRD